MPLASPARTRAAGFRSAAPGRRDRPVAQTRRRSRLRRRMPTPRSPTMTVIEAANPEEEALAIAVALREAVQRRQDRGAGHAGPRARPPRADGAAPLEHRGGGFRRRCARRYAGRDFCPARRRSCARWHCRRCTLLALLKHPLLRLWRAAARVRGCSERAILRGPRPRAGSNGLAQALANFRIQLGKFRAARRSICIAPIRARGLTRERACRRGDLVTRLGAALAPLEGLARAALSARRACRGAIATCSRACRTRRRRGVAFTGPDGTKLADALDELATSDAAAGLRVEASDYVELFSAALGRPGRAARRRSPACACGSSARSKRA